MSPSSPLPCIALHILGLCTMVMAGFAADEVTYHPGLKPLDLKAPGRVAILPDESYACASKGRLFLSKDKGTTWESVSEITAGTGPKIDSGMLIADHDGTLVLIYRDDAGMKLERTPDNMPLPGARLQVWASRSTDGGKTWRDHQPLIEGFCGAIIGAICTRENRLVIPLQDLRYDPPRHVTVVFTSSDAGKTWHKSADLDIGGHGMEDGGFESTVAQRQDGSLLMILRSTRDRLWRAESQDQGLTWTLPVPTDIKASNSPAYVLSLKSGNLALVWNPLFAEGLKDGPRRTSPRYAERPDSVFREEMCFALSSDGGDTWTAPRIIAKQKGGKLRYAYMLEPDPGEIWLVLKGQFVRLLESDFLPAPR